MKVTVDKNGRVTIPKHLREQFAIATGQVLELNVEAGQLILAKAKCSDVFHTGSPFYGMMELQQSVDETVRQLRDPG